MSDDLSGAGITAKERLERIEHLLAIIDTKLDGKANQVDLLAVDLRVKDIELWRASADAEDRVSAIERAASDDAHEKRHVAAEQTGVAVRRWIAVASGVISVVVIAANLVVPQYLAK